MLNKIRKLQNKKGFTLVELIVVIAIIAILTAVIVPLVGRYSAQATYTTLNDGAKTCSTAIASALSDATMSGALANIKSVAGDKTNGTSIKITVVTSATPAVTLTFTKTTAANDAGTLTGSASDVQKKFLEKAAEQLLTAIPEGASFFCDIYKNAVNGTAYRTDKNNKVTAVPSNVKKADGFENAYEDNIGAIGLQGSFVPQS